jgi:hypothetical protein
MNELIPDKQAYQLNKRRMAWTCAWYDDRVYDCSVDRTQPEWPKQIAVLMMMYGSLSALVGAYFGFSGGAVKNT